MLERWIFRDEPEKTPDAPGIYAILVCWDSTEGYFPGTGVWDGKKWDDLDWAIAAFIPEPQPDKAAAETLAYENDPGW